MLDLIIICIVNALSVIVAVWLSRPDNVKQSVKHIQALTTHTSAVISPSKKQAQKDLLSSLTVE